MRSDPLPMPDPYLVKNRSQVVGLGVEVGFQLGPDVFDSDGGAGNAENSFLLQPRSLEMRENSVED